MSKKLEALKAKLEEVSTDLRTVRGSQSDATEKALLSQRKTVERASLQSKGISFVMRPNSDVDSYEKTEKESEVSGIYRLESDKENNYKISFSSYIDT